MTSLSSDETGKVGHLAALSPVKENGSTQAGLSSNYDPLGLDTDGTRASRVGLCTSETTLPQRAFNANADLNSLLRRFFSPRIAVVVSADTNHFVSRKGITSGFVGLLRSFGEEVAGNVVIRDSAGAGKSCSDYGVFFQSLEDFKIVPGQSMINSSLQSALQSEDFVTHDPLPGQLRDIERVLHYHLDAYNSAYEYTIPFADESWHKKAEPASALYQKYLQKLLLRNVLLPHEGFRHPVACVIAVRARSDNPIGALRELYNETTKANSLLYPWLNTDYLRYYVLLHDEETDDIVKSTALFDLMKRNFGLHCHLLRLKGSTSVLTDEDSLPIPTSTWLSAQEELDLFRQQDLDGNSESSMIYISESDTLAIKGLVRELVTQSVVPFMENRVALWNEQVASRKRGLSGRFMSLSKRWTGFTSPRNAHGGSSTSGASSTTDYDAESGHYALESPENIMRQLAEHALMLRDYKLAQQAYDIVRSDFSHDKAWLFYASATEMSGISILLAGQNGLTRGDLIEQLVDSALYSYMTRCGLITDAVRCLSLSMELLGLQHAKFLDVTVKLARRLLEIPSIGRNVQALTVERIGEHLKASIEPSLPDRRTRQAHVWNIMAALSWCNASRPERARNCLTSNKLLPLVRDVHLTSYLPLRRDIEKMMGDGLGMDIQGIGTPISDQQVQSALEVKSGIKIGPEEFSPLAKEGIVLQSDGFE